MRAITLFSAAVSAASAAVAVASLVAFTAAEAASDLNHGRLDAVDFPGVYTDAADDANGGGGDAGDGAHAVDEGNAAGGVDAADTAEAARRASSLSTHRHASSLSTHRRASSLSTHRRASSLSTHRHASSLSTHRRASSPSTGLGFTFVRIQYEGTRRSYSPTWSYDYPRAERHLYEAIDRTTDIHIEGPPIVLTLTDERIFEYPILYLCEPGYWRTNDEEVAALQRYFERGGFMIIDDFHDGGRGSVGPEWNNFYKNIKQIFPDREPVELTADHPIWTVYYDIDPDAAVSTKVETRQTPWLGPEDDIYYGIFDDDGRLMCVICYNQDIGDGWEWPEYNFNDGSTVSFQMAINFIIYALTH